MAAAAFDYASGDILLAAGSAGDMGGGTNAGSTDMFVSRFDSDGSNKWCRLKGSSAYDLGYSLACDNDGNTYVVGYTEGNFGGYTNAGGQDIFLTKYDSLGNELWTRVFGSPANDSGQTVAVSPDGSVYVGGNTMGELDGQPNVGSWDLFISKFTPNGEHVWTRTCGSSGQETGNMLVIDSVGNPYLAGYTAGSFGGQSNPGGFSFCLVRYDADGAHAWTRIWGSAVADFGYGAAAAPDDRIYVVGLTDSSFGGQTNTNPGTADLCLTCYHSDGSQAWVRISGSTASDAGSRVSVDANGSVYVGGWTEGVLDGQVNAGGRDAFLAKYTAEGERLWTRVWGATAEQLCHTAAVGYDGSIYCSGYTAASLDGEPFAGGMDIFVSKWIDESLCGVSLVSVTDVGASAASLNGAVLGTGATNATTVAICWGRQDMGCTVFGWDAVTNLGYRSSGQFSVRADGLLPGTSYVARAFVIGVATTNWAASALTFTTEGLDPFSCALYLDGVDDYVEIPDDSTLDLPGPYTIELWTLIPDSLDLLDYCLVSKDPSDSLRNYYLGVRGKSGGNHVHFAAAIGGNRTLDSSDPAVSELMWHHIAGVYNGSEMRVYVDGVQQGVAFVSGVAAANSAPLTIGCDVQPTRRFVRGYVDEVRISDAARYTTNFVPEVRFAPDANTMALYHFDECGGTNVSDSSGNGNDGVVHGGAAMHDADRLLVVDATPARYGAVTPAYGIHPMEAGTVVTATVPAMVAVSNGVRIVANGFVGQGDVPVTGSGTDVIFTFTTNSALIWQWGTEYELRASAGPGGSVSFTSSWFAAGSSHAQCTAIPDVGHYFAGWSGDASGGSETITITMVGPRSIVATFGALPHIDTAAASGGSVSPDGRIYVTMGGETSVVIAAAGGHHIARVLADGMPVADFGPADVVYTQVFANVTANQTLYAEFNSAPVIGIRVTPVEGVAPLRVSFDFTPSEDAQSNIVRSDVDIDGDGVVDVHGDGEARLLFDYGKPGTYSGTVTVVDGFGLADSTTVVVRVLGIAPAADLQVVPADGTAPLTVTLSANASVAGTGRSLVVFEWDLDGDGTYDGISSTGTVTHTYTAPGSYTPAVRVTDDFGLQDSASASVTVSPAAEPPSVLLAASPDEGTVPLLVTLTANASDNGPIGSYQWDLTGDGQPDVVTTTNVLTHAFTEVGVFLVSVVVRDEDGLTAQDTVTVSTREASRLKVWISMPKADAQIWGSNVTVHAQTAPGSLTAGVQLQYRIAESNTWFNLGPGFVPPPHSFKESWNVAALADGLSYDLRAVATDTDGNTVTSENVRVVADAGEDRVPGRVVEGEENGRRVKAQTFAATESAVVLLADGTGVQVPVGAVGTNPTVVVQVLGTNTNPLTGAAYGQGCAHVNREVSIEGNPALLRPVTIEIPYPDDDSDGIVDGTGIPETTLSAYWYDTSSGTWRRALRCDLNADANVLRLSTYHLTEFGLFGEVNLLNPANGGVLLHAAVAATNHAKAENLADGNKSSFWKSTPAPAEDAVFIYGFTNYQGAILDEAILYNSGAGTNAYSSGFELWGMSETNGGGQLLASGVLPADETPVVCELGGVTSRYVKLVITNGYSSDAWALAELSVKGALTPDPDSDGMYDAWEMQYFGSFDRSGGADYENDGLTDLVEFEAGANPVTNDTDGDLMLDAWEVTHGLAVAGNDAGADGDRDGMSNLEEYIAGMNPADTDSRFELAMPAARGTWLTNEVYDPEDGVWTSVVLRVEQLVFEWQAQSGRRYRIYGRTNFTDGVWEPLTGPISGTGGSHAFTNSADAPQRFYRIGVELEP